MIMKKEYLIKELKHAQTIHRKRAYSKTLPQNRRVNLRVAKQKEIIIQVLQGKILIQPTHINIVKRWRNIHQKWIDYLKYYKDNPGEMSKEDKESIKEEGDTIHWHKRWVKTYNKILNYLLSISDTNKSIL